MLGALLAFWCPVAISLRLYSGKSRESELFFMLRATQAVITAVSMGLITSFLFAGLTIEMGREYIWRLIPLACVAVFLARFAGSRAALHASSRWPVKPCLALVAERVDSMLADRLRRVESAVLKGMIVPASEVARNQPQPLPVLGTTRDLAAVINRERLDQIIILNGAISEHEVRTCNLISRRMGITLSWAFALPEINSNLTLSSEFGIHVVELNPVTFSRWDRLVKRAFDLVVTSASIVLLMPVLLAIATLIKMTSQGPVLYTAPRVGRGGRYFTFLKFRTMYAGSSRELLEGANEKDGHLFKMRQDPRVTPLGRILRRYSLDELPQLFNVVLGDMSLVGPRPLPAEDLDPDGLSAQFAAWSEQRASVSPGITGLWQIRGRSELPFTDLIRYDMEYVHNWSLALDMKILLQTPMFVLSGRGAY
jgi:exopolysaccharide biosynthesis polyprenyl glycosylphosphotransferase